MPRLFRSATWNKFVEKIELPGNPNLDDGGIPLPKR